MPNSKTRVRSSLLATVLLVVLLGGGHASSVAKNASAEGPATSTLSAQEQPAAELARFYEQELTFGSCEGFGATALEAQVYTDPFECGRLEVPLDYADPEGETMQIAVLRLSSLP